jgi:hypothetical protein
MEKWGDWGMPSFKFTGKCQVSPPNCLHSDSTNRLGTFLFFYFLSKVCWTNGCAKVWTWWGLGLQYGSVEVLGP